jgi:hypothetical protein
MKRFQVLSTSALLLAALGCAEPEPGLEQRHSLNVWLANSLKKTSAVNAIIRGRTLYPYHFVEGSAELNDLGHADLDVLANHYRSHPGKLNLRQGEAPAELYGARKKTVLEYLGMAGVEPQTVAIEDGIPGGDGADSERVIQALATEREKESGGSTGDREGQQREGQQQNQQLGSRCSSSGMKGYK